MVHGKNRIPYWIDRRLNGLAGPEYDATISFGLPFEPEDSQYGEYRLYIKGLRIKPLCLRTWGWASVHADYLFPWSPNPPPISQLFNCPDYLASFGRDSWAHHLGDGPMV